MKKGIAMTAPIIVLMMTLLIIYTVFWFVQDLASRAGAEYWQRSSYYIASRAADDITNLAYAEEVTSYDLRLDFKDEEEMSGCELWVYNGMVFVSIDYKEKATMSGSKVILPAGVSVDSSKQDCKTEYIVFSKEYLPTGTRIILQTK